MIMKMQDDANNLQTHLSEISKELQNVRANIQIFEKADQMKRQLEENIQNLNEGFDRLEDFGATADQFKSQFGTLVKMNDDIANQITVFESQKVKLESLGASFANVSNMANQIDNQVHQLNATKDELQTMEVTVRNYNEKLQYLTEQYEKLDRKDEVLNRITKDVDTSFDRLKELEQRLTNANRQIVSLPNEIKEVQTNVDKILQNGPRITNAVTQLEKLDDLITQTNEQIENIQSTKGGIDKTVMNLSAMNREVEDKFKTLRQITETQIKNEPASVKSSSGIAPAKRDMVRTLKRQGWTTVEIAKRVGMTENEVDLILQLPE